MSKNEEPKDLGKDKTYKLLEKIKSKMGNFKDVWGIQKLLKTKEDSKELNLYNVLLTFNPYYTNDSPSILTLHYTTKGIFILLKNGKIFRFSNEMHKNPSQIIDNIYSDRIPYEIRINTKIMDLSCGIEHVLLRGRDCKIYSMGINSYGQLGIENIKVGPNVEISEPTAISKLSERKINQIKAVNFCSFCIDENNKLFGFGKNENGEINKMKEDNYIMVPEELVMLEKNKNYKLFIHKDGKIKYFGEMILPEKSLQKAYDIPILQNLNEEIKIKNEIKELKHKLNQLRKVRVTIEDYKNLINDINDLILKYEEKANKNEIEKNDNNEPIKNFERKIEFFENLKNNINNKSVYINKYLKNIDPRLNGNNNNNTNSKNDDEKKDPSYLSNTPEDIYLYSKDIPQIGTLFERVGSELQIQKYRYLETFHKDKEKQKVYQRKNIQNKIYIQIFKDAIKEAKNKINELLNVDIYEEAENIKEKCLNEYQTFSENTLYEITVRNLDIQESVNLSLNDFTEISSNNLLKLTEKIKNLQISLETNKLGANIIDIFNKNIILAHQNNYLLSYILNNLVKPVYNITLEKALKFNNPKNFNELKNKIEELKIQIKKNPKILEKNNVKNKFDEEEEMKNKIKAINVKEIVEEMNKKKNEYLKNKNSQNSINFNSNNIDEEDESQIENPSQIGELESDDDLN
jgi:hypothetical protein